MLETMKGMRVKMMLETMKGMMKPAMSPPLIPRRGEIIMVNRSVKGNASWSGKHQRFVKYPFLLLLKTI